MCGNFFGATDMADPYAVVDKEIYAGWARSCNINYFQIPASDPHTQNIGGNCHS